MERLFSNTNIVVVRRFQDSQGGGERKIKDENKITKDVRTR